MATGRVPIDGPAPPEELFEKTDVNNRGELVARIYFDCYDLRAPDNRERIQAEQYIRGGPKNAAGTA